MFQDESESDYYESFMAGGEPEFDFDEMNEAEVRIDIEDYRDNVWQRLFQHYVCALKSSPTPAASLLTEAELHMQSYDYKQALTCALAAASVDLTEGVKLRSSMIQAISMYQLGDRKSAVGITEEIGEDFDAELISDYLMKRYKGTCEVLGFMPDLLGLLAGMTSRADEGSDYYEQ